MELSSEFVGMKSHPYTLGISKRRAMNFAASIFDANLWYFDDVRPEGIVVHPMIAVALSWHMTVDAGKFWEMGNFPVEVLSRQVHYSEYLQWHRPMVPDEEVSVSAELAAVLPHRAGVHLINKYTATGADGAPVFTEWAGAMLRDVKCSDGGAGQENVPTSERFRSGGETLWETPIHVHPLAAHIYDGCADIHFPIHTSVAFARQVGLPNILLHGTSTLGMAVREILNREGDGDPRRLRDVACHFTGMVFMDTTITVQALGKTPVEGGERVHFLVLDHEGKRAIRNAHLTIGAP